jgi:hypothetical protein
MKPTDADLEALAVLMAKHEGIADGACLVHREAAAIAWDYLVPLVLERVALRFETDAYKLDDSKYSSSRDAASELRSAAESLRALKDEK